MEEAVRLVTVREDEMTAFKKRLQTAFTQAAQQAFPGFTEVIPPESDIDESLEAPGAEALQVVQGDTVVGGAITSGDGADKLLDFIFIDPECQDRHLGFSAWQAIEARYPDAGTWELVTPYHEKRNIHFYVNRCGFKIVEYYNERHPDPHFPQEEAEGVFPDAESGLFRFQKVMG